jgi:hypothetical protein
VANPSLFYAIAGISMSFAGFAGLFLALRPRDTELQRYEVGQLSAIVLFALTALFGALFVVPVASLIGEPDSYRVMSAIVLLIAVYLHEIKVGTSWLRWSRVQNDLTRRDFLIGVAPFALVSIAQQAVLAVNVFAARQELYELALILTLGTPALVFVRVIEQMSASRRS